MVCSNTFIYSRCTYVRVPSRLFFLVVFVLMCHQLLIGGKKMLSSGIELTKYTHPQSCCIQRRPTATVARTIVCVLVALVTHTGVFFGMVFIERIARNGQPWIDRAQKLDQSFYKNRIFQRGLKELDRCNCFHVSDGRSSLG